MLRFKTVVGEKQFSLADLDDYDRTVEVYEKSLRTPIANENGETKVQLVGIDGKPTADRRIFSSRQKIMKHLKKAKKEYCTSKHRKNCTLLDFYNYNSNSMSAKLNEYMSLDSFYYSYRATYLGILNQLKECHDEYVRKSASVTARDITSFMDSLYDYLLKMKMVVSQMSRVAQKITILNFTNYFIEKGIDFFDDSSYFEYGFAEYLRTFQKEIDDFQKQLDYNKKVNSISEYVF